VIVGYLSSSSYSAVRGELAGVRIDGDVCAHQPVNACGGGQDLMAVVLDPRIGRIAYFSGKPFLSVSTKSHL
jgi:hypothetical protein